MAGMLISCFYLDTAPECRLLFIRFTLQGWATRMTRHWLRWCSEAIYNLIQPFDVRRLNLRFQTLFRERFSVGSEAADFLSRLHLKAFSAKIVRPVNYLPRRMDGIFVTRLRPASPLLARREGFVMPSPGVKQWPSTSRQLMQVVAMGMFSGAEEGDFPLVAQAEAQHQLVGEFGLASPGVRSSPALRRRGSRVQCSSKLAQPVSAPRCRPFS